MIALAQQACRLPVAQHSHKQPDVFALWVLGQGLGCQVWLLGQVAFGFRRHHDPFDGQSHTVDLCRPREPGKEGLQR